MAEKTAALGDGLYLIGLRNHIGFVRVVDGVASFIHSGPSGSKAAAVQSEALADAPTVVSSRPSGYFVTPVVTAAGDEGGRLVDHWLGSKPIPFQKLGYP